MRSLFNLLDDVYTDHLACSYTSYQIPNIQFDQVCSRIGSFTHYNLLLQIDQQIQHRSIFYNELKQLSDQLMNDLILSNHLWYSVEEALIEIDSIDKADLSSFNANSKN